MKRAIARYSLGALLVGVGAVVYRFPPQEYRFYPRCPVYAFTHFLCPGCGGTRALYEMLHGNLAAAWHYNAFLTVLLPLTLVWSVVVWFRAARSNQLPDFSVPRPAWIVMALIAILFTMARNTGLAFVI